MTHDSLPCLADQERKLVEHFCTLVDRVVYLRPRRHAAHLINVKISQPTIHFAS